MVTHYTYYMNGDARTVSKWNDNKKLHTDTNEPSFIHYYPDGNYKERFWHKNGLLHNVGNPSSETFYKQGNVKSRTWHLNGKRESFHSFYENLSLKKDIVYDENGEMMLLKHFYMGGQLKQFCHYFNGKLHNVEGCPAHTTYYENGSEASCKWMINGEQYRDKDDKGKSRPTYEEYYENGKIKKQMWCACNVLHRNDGPALIEYFEDGTIKPVIEN